MGATVGQINARVGLDDAAFRQGVGRVQKGFRDLGQVALRTAEAIDRALGNALKAAGNATGGLDGLLNAFSGLGGMAGNALRGVLGLFGNLAGSVMNLAGQISGALTSALTGALNTAAGLATTLGGALGAALIAVGKAGLDFNATMAQGRIGLTAVLGSTEAAEKGMSAFKKMADDSLLSLQDVTGQGTQLARAFGKSGWSQVLPSMQAFDTAAKVNQVSIDNTRLALLQFRQLIQRDFAQQEELGSIGENMGLNVAGMLRKAFGTSDTEALKAAGISAKQVAKALVDGINKELGPQAAAMGRSLPIVLSGFGDVFGKIAGKATEAFGPRLTGALDGILGHFNKLADSGSLIKALEVPFTLVARAIEAVGAHLPNLVDWLGKVATQENVVRLLADIGGWIKTLGEEVMRFISAASGGQSLGNVFSTFAGIAEKAIDTVLRGWNVLVSSIKFFVDNAGEIWQMFTDAMGPAQRALDTLIGAVTVLIGLAATGKVAEFFGNVGSIFGGKDIGATITGRGVKGPDLTKTPSSKPAPVKAAAAGGLLARFGPKAAAIGTAARFLPYLMDQPIDDGSMQRMSDRLGPLTQRLFGGNTAHKLFPLMKAPEVMAAGKPADPMGQAMGGLADIGAKVRQGVLRGAMDAAGKVPDRVKNLWSGFQNQAQNAWATGGLDALKKRQEEAAKQLQGQINKALAPRVDPNSGIAPGHVMSVRGAGDEQEGPKLVDPKEAEKIRGAREAAFDALLSHAKALSEVAPEGQKAQTEAAMVLPALAAKLEEMKRQALALLPEARKSADGAKDYWNVVRDGWNLQGQMNQLQARAQEEARNAIEKAQKKAKELAEKALAAVRKQATERRQLIEADKALTEAQLGLFPWLNDKQKKKALLPFLEERFAELMRPVQGENRVEAIQRETSATTTAAEILEALGGKKLGIRGTQQVLGYLDRLGAQSQANPYRAKVAQMPAMPAVNAVAAVPPSPYGADGMQVHNNQMTISLSGRELTWQDFETFYRMYQEARQRESRNRGVVAPAGGFIR